MTSFFYRKSQVPKFKLIVLGDTGVGKTTLISRLTDQKLPGFQPTIGCSFSNLKYQATDTSPEFEIHVWDTAGQERYNSILDIYFHDVDLCLLVYDINKLASLERIFQVWLPRYLESKHNNTADYSRKLFYLIGNKDDQLPQNDPSCNLQLKKNLKTYRDTIHRFQMELWQVSALENHHMGQLMDSVREGVTTKLIPRFKEVEANQAATKERSGIISLTRQISQGINVFASEGQEDQKNGDNNGYDGGNKTSSWWPNTPSIPGWMTWNSKNKDQIGTVRNENTNTNTNTNTNENSTNENENSTNENTNNKPNEDRSEINDDKNPNNHQAIVPLDIDAKQYKFCLLI